MPYFIVHTEKAPNHCPRFRVEASKPDEARRIVKRKHPDAKITKVKRDRRPT